MKRLLAATIFAVVSGTAYAESYLFENVRIFNGVDDRLTAGHVLVDNGIISKISSEQIDTADDVVVIDGGNRVLSPGFIDLHVHLTMHVPADQPGDHGTLIGAYSVAAAKFFLDSGFTTIRDAGGTHPDLARAINSGSLYGPRVFPSGAIVSQTAGHGDWRNRSDPHPSHIGAGPYMAGDNSILADGVEKTLIAVRENLKNGATQIKIMGGGGVMSDFDPIHTLQPSPAEIQAAVQAAGDWGTYVLAHAYTSEAIQRLVENGVKCIEHGLLIDDATARLVAKNNVVISTQITIFKALGSMAGLSDNNREKAELVAAGQENLIGLINKYDILTGFSTDFIYGQYHMLPQEFTNRAEYWSPAEVLNQATAQSAKIIRMAGKLNRYGNFGEIREGWVADLLLINGEPLQDLSIFADPGSALALIMKDGEIVKTTL
ncbi:MAG: amidohydrolase family protein [Gammaproteobacteria bacterium]|nr:amidohydrolase family protein [Gammaproteobacteria bacterium]